MPGIIQIANGDMRLARLIWIKARLRQEFPMNYTEIILASSTSSQPVPGGALPAKPEYVNALTAPNGPIAKGFVAGNEPTPAENSACLLMALTLVNRAGINISPDDLGAHVLADTDLDGLNEIVDGWRTPIMFFRWPFANQELQNLNPGSTGTTATFQDPQDSEGLLISPYPYSSYPTFVTGYNWWNSVGRINFEWLCHSLSVPNPNPPVPPLYLPWPPYPHEYYMIPVVASAGPNKVFGLYNTAPYPALNPLTSPYPSQALWPNPMLGIQAPDVGVGDDNDNIYSYRLRLGAPGN
jgi:hypothetical protein